MKFVRTINILIDVEPHQVDAVVKYAIDTLKESIFIKDCKAVSLEEDSEGKLYVNEGKTDIAIKHCLDNNLPFMLIKRED